MIQEKRRFRLFPEGAVAPGEAAVAVPAVEAVQEEAEAPAEHRWF